jgi:hypothetical protein
MLGTKIRQKIILIFCLIFVPKEYREQNSSIIDVVLKQNRKIRYQGLTC